MRSYVAITLVFLGLAIPASGKVNLEAICSGGEAEITICMINTYSNDYVGVAVTRAIVGTCDEPVVVTSEYIPLPAPAEPIRENIECISLAVSAPLANVVYRFEALLVDSSGNFSAVPSDEFFFMPPLIPYDFASDEGSVVMRGILSWASGSAGFVNIFITPCTVGCWGESVPVLLVVGEPIGSELHANAASGVVFDVVGLPKEIDGMLDSGEAFDFIELRPTEGAGCAPVPIEGTSWDSFKAQFR